MIHTERLQGEFVRRIPLPAAAEPSGLHVNFARGLLLIQIPKLSPVGKRTGVSSET
jgi:HSP20 family molecular chaperone IbpA